MLRGKKHSGSPENLKKQNELLPTLFHIVNNIREAKIIKTCENCSANILFCIYTQPTERSQHFKPFLKRCGILIFQVHLSKQNLVAQTEPSDILISSCSTVCRTGEHTELPGCQTKLVPAFKEVGMNPNFFPLNTDLQHALLLIITPLLLASALFHCFYYPYFPSLSFIFVKSTFTSQVMICVLLLPYSTLS